MAILQGSRVKGAIALLSVSFVVISSASAGAATRKTVKKKATPAKVTPTTAAPVTAAPVTTAPATTKAPGPKAAFGKKSDTLYEGKGGFKVDLSKCPKDWDVNQGITDKEIRMFTSLPKSGPFAGFGLVADGMNSYFKLVNEQGGVAGRKLVLDFKDDSYQADRTKANVAEAISARKYAGLVTVIGTPNNLAIWDDTNKECMPQLLNGSGVAQFGDVDDHPFTTGMQLDYTSEAGLWAEWAKKEFPRGAKVAMLTLNNDFGKSYSRGFRAVTKGTNIQVVREEIHEGTAPNVTNQMTNIESVLPDIILLQTSGVFCTQAMAEIEKRGIKPKVMMSATCASLGQFFQPLIAQGLTGEGTYIVQTFKDVNDEEFKDDPFIKLYHATTASQGLDSKQSTYGTGWVFAWYLVEMAKEAATYEGGLNRANLLLAARGLTKINPLLVGGLSNNIEGTKDAYLVEGGRFVQYKVRDPKELGTYFPQGSAINRDGGLGTYKKSLAD